ncbi:MAG: ATP-binding protein [Chitinophagaceae bacterium]|nr:MAG: ATP-binding protein [Chitinophagaceae bacterium]
MNKKFSSIAELMVCLEQTIGSDDDIPDHTLICDGFMMSPETAKGIHALKVHLRDEVIVTDRSIPARSKKAGFNVLFDGKAEQAKILTAKLLANQSGLNVQKIDLSAVFSKYIGETEKNLNTVFAEAVRNSAILFFDEADALFGKRTDIKEAHDKYANAELLDVIDTVPLLKIFTAKSKSNLDDAFLRRIRNVIHFPGSDEQDTRVSS